MFSNGFNNNVPEASNSASFKVLNSFDDFDESVYEKMHETLKFLLSFRNTPLSTTTSSSSSSSAAEELQGPKALQNPQGTFKEMFKFQIDYPIMDTLFCELQNTLTKLDSEIFRSNDARMSAFLDISIFAPLAWDTNLDHVNEALLNLDALFTGQSGYAFRPVLKRNVDRIVLLCAGQLHFAGTTYLTGLESKKKEDEQVKRVQKFIDAITQLLSNLLVKNVMNLSGEIDRDSLTELMHSLLPFLAYSSIYGASTEAKPCKSVSFYGLYMLLSKMFKPEVTTGGQSSVRTKLMAVVLRMLRDLTVESLKDGKESKQANQSIDLLTKLLMTNGHSWEYAHGYFRNNNTKDLSSVVYEIYALFELYSKLSTAFLHNNSMQAIESLKSYICSLFRELGLVEAWKHFETVDKEIAVGKCRTIEVALFKFLAGRGFAWSSSEEEKMMIVRLLVPSRVTEDSIVLNQNVGKPMKPKAIQTVSKPVDAKLVAAPQTQTLPRSLEEMKAFSSKQSNEAFMRLQNATGLVALHKARIARTTKSNLSNSSKVSTAKASNRIEPMSSEPIEAQLKPVEVQKKPNEFPKALVVELQKKLDELLKKPFEVQEEPIKIPKNPVDPVHKSELEFAKAFDGLISTVPTTLAEPIQSTSIEISTSPASNQIEPSKREASVEYSDSDDSDVVILDVDNNGEVEIPVLKPSKVVETSVEPTGETQTVVDEASFEIIDKTIEIPETNVPKALESKESVVEKFTLNQLYPNDKEALLNQVKQMYADILKTQKSIDKLMQKLANNIGNIN